MARLRLAAVFALVSVLLLASGAAAQEEQAEGALLLIMDASNSMNETDDAGTPLIQGAKQALNEVVDTLPEGSPVGLRVYGHRTPEAEGQAEGCRDTELIVPVGPLIKEEMSSAIAGYRAKGWTPIGLSLREAAEDLPSTGERTIVLVSDGEDTCGNPPPCEVARDLDSRGVDVTIETVGFFVEGNQDAERQLTCIAEATGGSYRDANSAGDLADELTTISARAARTFQAEGERVTGGPSSDEAPVLEPGTYRDTIVSAESLWYAVELQEGQELRARATVGGISGGLDEEDFTVEDDYVEMSMYNTLNEEILDPAPADQCCVGPNAVSVSNTTGVVSPDETYADEPGPYYVQVSIDDRLDDNTRPYEFPLELEFEVTGQAAGATTVQEPQVPPEDNDPQDPPPEEPERSGGFLYMLGIGALVGAFLAFPTGVVLTVLVMRRL